MKVAAISATPDDDKRRLLWAQHQLRARVFAGRLGWQVDVSDGLEIDEFDSLKPTYILAQLADGTVVGCARLLPATGPTMLASVFPELMPKGFLVHDRMIESSRFCVDTEHAGSNRRGLAHEATLTMFSGILEWCFDRGYTEIVTVTDLRLERILARVGWPLKRISPPRSLGVTEAVAGILEVHAEIFSRLRADAYCSEISHQSAA